ncbi:MAG: hypothetical protein KatS3mg102_2889 [Planctomycetota bacterium]|nr:MAG: hypothetical protein KatS3mg102_2889 [Planctomycetota bacterium]
MHRRMFVLALAAGLWGLSGITAPVVAQAAEWELLGRREVA